MELFDAACDLDPEARARFLEELTDRHLAEDLAELLEADAAGTPHLAGLPPEAPTDEHPVRIDDYRIVGELGRGGMGIVYEAEQQTPRRRVAIKLLRAAWGAPHLQRRLRFEARVLARLEHPGIARLYQVGVFDGRPYLVMELIDGLPLTTFATEHELSLRARAELLADVADAVHHAHAVGFVHRDLKPANILVQQRATHSSGAFAQPRVLDFGIARSTREDETQPMTVAGAALGTPAYMSPEQTMLSGDELDARSDVYSLGVIGYELMAGRPPYPTRGRALWEVGRIIRDVDPAPVASEVGGDLDAILQRALAKERDRRYPTAAALADDLRRYLEDRPVLARRPSPLYRLARFARRQRGLFAALVALFVSLVAGVVVSTAFFWKADDARRDLHARHTALQLQQARSLLATDPTRSVAVIAALEPPADASEVAEVRRRALARGVAVQRLVGHGDVVRGVAAAHGRVATAGYDGTVRLWDRETGTRRTLLTAPTRMTEVEIGPDATVAAVGEDGVVRMFTKDDRAIEVEACGHVDAIEWGPAGELAGATRDGSLCRWTLDGAVSRVRGRRAGSKVGPLVWAADGRIAAGRLDGIVRVWGEGAGDRMGHQGEVNGVAFAGADLVSGGVDRAVRVWTAAGVRVLGRHDHEVKAVAATPEFVAAVSRDGELSIWRLPSAERVRVAAHVGAIRDVKIGAGVVATGGDDGAVRLWYPDGGPAGERLGHTGPVRRLAVDGGELVSGSADGTAGVWEVETPGVVYGHAARVTAVAWASDTVVSADKAGVVRAGPRVLVRHEDRVYDLATHPSGWVATASRDHSMSVVHIDTGIRRHLPWTDRVRTVDFDAGGARVVASVGGNVAPVWDHATGRVVRLEGHTDRVAAARFGETTIGTTSDDGTVRVWDAKTGAPLAAHKNPGGAVRPLAVLGGRFVAGGSGGAVLTFDAQKLTRLEGHEGAVTAIAASPGTSGMGILASGGLDGAVRVWRDGRSRVLGSHDGAVLSLAISPTGLVVSGGADRIVRIDGRRVIAGFADAVVDLATGADRIAVSDGDLVTLQPY